MKAIVYTEYGSPDVLQLKDVEKPTPKDNEVLIKIHATTVNRTDCGFRQPEYFIVRLIGGLFKPRKTILGSELAGVVEAIGKNVKSFKPGDEVFGLSAYNFGAHAEYICIPEKGSIAIKPSNVSFEDAAAVCDGLFLALNYIRKIDFSKNPTILINGASGSIGSAGLQLAKYYGSHVTAVCATKNISLMKSLGADEVIDYTKEDFTQNGKTYDVILDSVGMSSFFKCRASLNPVGIYFSSELGYMSQNPFLALITPLLGGKKVLFPIPKDTKEDIVFFGELLSSGKYKAVIDRTWPLEEIKEATRYVETKQKTGNVVIKVL